MKENEARDRVRHLLQTQPLGVLATAVAKTTHASLVAIAATPDLREIVFATSRATRKFEFLRRNPRVSLLVDNRSNEVRDFRDASAATAHGLAAEAPEDRREALRGLYLDKHPHLSDFVRASSCALVTVAVEAYDLVGNFQEVHILHVRDEPDTNG